MDYLQYEKYDKKYSFIRREVLNLIINGLPSIHEIKDVDLNKNKNMF